MFTFPLDLEELFAERTRQFIGWGIPERVVRAVRDGVDDAWGDAPRGWTPAWERQAQAAEAEEDWLLGALCHGAAKFPCLATASRIAAYGRQLACYERAAADFPLRFERRALEAPYHGGTTPVPVHLLHPRRRSTGTLLVLCGGVDTWKVELHRLGSLIARTTGWRVATIDMPGTGESRVPLAPDADLLLRAVIEQLAGDLRAAGTAFFGISFGGHWAAKLALDRAVDAAVDLGGPVGATDEAHRVADLPGGMSGIVGNAVGLDAMPTPAEVAALFDAFSLRAQGLLDRAGGSPLLVVNGTEDPYVPGADTTVFRERPEATVWLLKDATHCAAERMRRVMPAAIAWLAAALSPGTATRLVSALARQPLRTLLAEPRGPRCAARRPRR